MAAVFLDTNVFLRHLLHDHEDQSPRATAFLARIERGDIQARVTDTVIFEIVFTLERTYKQGKRIIRDTVMPLIELPGILLTSKGVVRRAFDLYADHNISFADAFHASVMARFGLTDIVTFDRGFERVSGIRRIEL